MERRSVYRIGLASIVLLSTFFLVAGNLSSATTPPFSEFEKQSELPVEDRTRLAQPTDGTTVVTSHLGATGHIVALDPDGTLLYYNDTHDGYWDVDPVPNDENTVVYSATAEVRNRSLCTPVDDEDYCIRQMIEKTDLATGETTVLYSRVDPRYHGSEWHDVDRINRSHYIVADMYADEVFVVNVSSGVVVWEWSLQNHFALGSGGPYPKDWAHLNDVEVLEDGRIMLSPRNMDQVIFLDPQQGTVDGWTIGTDGEHDILYEQHNPDFIPESDGGPAVLIADSENNRVIEYQRDAGRWNETWVWQDNRLQWARDADRLPNGHTLVTDSLGGRVIEVNTDGEIVWSFDVPTAYEAERLNTGDESTGGPSAVRSNLTSQSLADARERERPSPISVAEDTIKSIVPNKVRNAVSNVTPPWVGLFDLMALLVGVFTIVAWVGLEFRWSTLRLRNPITRLRIRSPIARRED